MFGRRGQSTLEYVIVLTAIIAAIIVVAATFLRPRLQESMDKVTNEMGTAINRVDFGATAGGTGGGGGGGGGGGLLE